MTQDLKGYQEIVMKEFFVGLLVLFILSLLSVVGVLLFPTIVVLGFFLRWLISIVLVVLAIWLVGKVTLWGIERLRVGRHRR